MNKRPTFWLRMIVVIAIAALFSMASSVYLPLIVSLVLAFMLNPLVEFSCQLPCRFGRTALPRSLGILMAFLLFTMVLVVAGAFILLPFIREFDKFVIDLPGLMRKIQDMMLLVERQFVDVQLPDNIRDLANQAVDRAASFSVELAKRIVNAVFIFASQIVELVVVPVLTYYLLKDWRSLQAGFINAFSPAYQSRLRQVLHETGRVISGYIQGQVVISIIMGLLVFVGMYILGIDYPLVLGLLAALTEAIPVVGPIIGAVPAVLLAFIADPALAVKVIIFYIVIQQIENHLIVPKIMGHTIDLHPTLVILSLLIGGSLYGVVGMMLAVPITAILRVLARHAWYYDER